MTDRLKGFVVTLEQDTRVDDVDALLTAVRQLRGVAKVTPVVYNIDDEMNRQRVRFELEQKLWGALADEKARGRR